MKIKLTFHKYRGQDFYMIIGNFKNPDASGWTINGGEFNWKKYDCPARLFKLIDWKCK